MLYKWKTLPEMRPQVVNNALCNSATPAHDDVILKQSGDFPVSNDLLVCSNALGFLSYF